jgi:hypothetical protein
MKTVNFIAQPHDMIIIAIQEVVAGYGAHKQCMQGLQMLTEKDLNGITHQQPYVSSL